MSGGSDCMSHTQTAAAVTGFTVVMTLGFDHTTSISLSSPHPRSVFTPSVALTVGKTMQIGS